MFDEFFGDGVVTFVSERMIDFKQTPEKGDLTPEQKEFLSVKLGFELPKEANIRQVHGKKNVVITQDNLNEIEEADGLLTAERQIPLVVRTADCVPVFLFDPVKKVIGMIHAGWKGTKQQIVVQALSDMKEHWGCEAKDIKAALGPAIGARANEVGPEFKEYFPNEIIAVHERLHCDIPKANVNQLLSCGVLKENIKDCERCTVEDERYFSYRQEGETAGRMVSLIMLK